MDITIIGKPTEIQAAIDALDLLLDVRMTSAPEPAGDGRVQVHAVALDPQEPGYGAGELGTDEIPATGA